MTTKNQPVRIGDRLRALSQGVHGSLEEGEYRGNGVYKIHMSDGGGGANFDMIFKLSGGPQHYVLQRQDVPNEPQTRLKQDYSKVGKHLLGGAYHLHFH